jgi:hypothetical protein
MTRIDSHETSPARVDPPAQLPSRERLIVWGGISAVTEMYARIARGRSTGRGGRTWLFVAEYLIAWTGFGAAITAVQYPLERTGIVAGAEVQKSAVRLR